MLYLITGRCWALAVVGVEKCEVYKVTRLSLFLFLPRPTVKYWCLEVEVAEGNGSQCSKSGIVEVADIVVAAHASKAGKPRIFEGNLSFDWRHGV